MTAILYTQNPLTLIYDHLHRNKIPKVKKETLANSLPDICSLGAKYCVVIGLNCAITQSGAFSPHAVTDAAAVGVYPQRACHFDGCKLVKPFHGYLTPAAMYINIHDNAQMKRVTAVSSKPDFDILAELRQPSSKAARGPDVHHYYTEVSP